MLGSAIAYLMKFYAFFHLPVEGFAGGAVGGMEGGIVTIGTASASDLPVAVGACETGIEDYLLEALAVSALETAYE